jgi:hypothetical protein
MFYGRRHDLVDRYGISVSQMTTATFRLSYFPHSWLITRFVTRVIRRVPRVEQELLTLVGTPAFIPDFSGIRVARCLVFCVMFCRSLFVLLPLYLLAIVLSVLRIMASDYPFGIFTLFLHKDRINKLSRYRNSVMAMINSWWRSMYVWINDLC